MESVEELKTKGFSPKKNIIDKKYGRLTVLEPNMTDEEKIKNLEVRLASYEQNGAAKMYYALQRKMNEIGDLFNRTALNGINLDDPKDKSFDRMFKLIEKSETIANAANALKIFGGITGNEDKDVSKKPFVETIADSRR